MPLTHLSSVSFVGITKLRNTSGPLAGTSNAIGISRIRSGWPSRQPSAGNSGSFGILRFIAARHALFDPRGDRRNLCVRESSLPDELAESRLRMPRRHVARLRDFRDERAALGHVFVRDQRERRRFAGPMARDAVRVHDRRDRLSERDARSGRRLSRGRRARRSATGRRAASAQPQMQERETAGVVYS